jgi:uncharacterized membrane protein YjjP (DUF1212 family)
MLSYYERKSQMKISTNVRVVDHTEQEVCDFLLRYAAYLFGCGATCIRLEKNVQRIAAAYGKNAEITIMPRHIHLTISNADRSEAITSTSTVPHVPIDYDMNTRLSEISWNIADGKMNIEQAEAAFDAVLSRPPQNKSLVTVLVALANASFCGIFGGDAMSMLIVAIAVFAGYHLKVLLLGRHVDARVMAMSCAFVSAVLAAGDYLFGLSATPQVTISTCVLYLVPGIVFLNSFSDLLNKHYICAYSRLVEAAVMTCCFSLGLFVALMLMHVGMFN